jgi:hypothetical protein
MFLVLFFGTVSCVAVVLRVACVADRLSSLRFGSLHLSRTLQLFNMFVQHRSKQAMLLREKQKKKALEKQEKKQALKGAAVNSSSAPGNAPGNVTVSGTPTVIAAQHLTPTDTGNNISAHSAVGLTASSNVIETNTMNGSHHAPVVTSSSTSSFSPSSLPSASFASSVSSADTTAADHSSSTSSSTSTSVGAAAAAGAGLHTSPVLELPSPQECHKTDQWFGEWFYPTQWTKEMHHPKLVLGEEISHSVKTETQLLQLLRIYANELFILTYVQSTHTIYISYHDDASDADVLVSMLQAVKLSRNLKYPELAMEEFKDLEREKEKQRKKLLAATAAASLSSSSVANAINSAHLSSASASSSTSNAMNASNTAMHMSVQDAAGSPSSSVSISVSASASGDSNVANSETNYSLSQSTNLNSNVPNQQTNQQILTNPAPAGHTSANHSTSILSSSASSWIEGANASAGATPVASHEEMLQMSLEWANKHIDQVKALMEEKGWDTDTVVWGDKGTRVNWADLYSSSTASSGADTLNLNINAAGVANDTTKSN